LFQPFSLSWASGLWLKGEERKKKWSFAENEQEAKKRIIQWFMGFFGGNLLFRRFASRVGLDNLVTGSSLSFEQLQEYLQK
jgi:hypothetical protein